MTHLSVGWHSSMKVILNIVGAWAVSFTLAFFCSFLWLHQMLPHTRCHQPCPNLNHPQQRTRSTTWERKWSHLLSCCLREMGASVLFSHLATESLLHATFSGNYSISPPQFHFHFCFPSTSSSQAKACLSLPLKKSLSYSSGHCIHSVAIYLQSKL